MLKFVSSLKFSHTSAHWTSGLQHAGLGLLSHCIQSSKRNHLYNVLFSSPKVHQGLLKENYKTNNKQEKLHRLCTLVWLHIYTAPNEPDFPSKQTRARLRKAGVKEKVKRVTERNKERQF